METQPHVCFCSAIFFKSHLLDEVTGLEGAPRFVTYTPANTHVGCSVLGTQTQACLVWIFSKISNGGGKKKTPPVDIPGAHTDSVPAKFNLLHLILSPERHFW